MLWRSPLEFGKAVSGVLHHKPLVVANLGEKSNFNRVYVESQVSPTFPNFPISEGISQFVEMSRTAGTSAALRAFRKWVRERLATN